MKLSELIEKHGNKEVDEQAVINMLGLKKLDKPKMGERYWFVNTVVDFTVWEDDDIDSYYYSQGNCFPTKEKAKLYNRVLETESKLRQYAKEHNEGAIDWDNTGQEKCNIVLDAHFDVPDIRYSYIGQCPRTIYFTSSKIANAAVKAVGKEAVIEYLKYEW